MVNKAILTLRLTFPERALFERLFIVFPYMLIIRTIISQS